MPKKDNSELVRQIRAAHWLLVIACAVLMAAWYSTYTPDLIAARTQFNGIYHFIDKWDESILDQVVKDKEYLASFPRCENQAKAYKVVFDPRVAEPDQNLIVGQTWTLKSPWHMYSLEERIPEAPWYDSHPQKTTVNWIHYDRFGGQLKLRKPNTLNEFITFWNELKDDVECYAACIDTDKVQVFDPSISSTVVEADLVPEAKAPANASIVEMTISSFSVPYEIGPSTDNNNDFAVEGPISTYPVPPFKYKISSSVLIIETIDLQTPLANKMGPQLRVDRGTFDYSFPQLALVARDFGGFPWPYVDEQFKRMQVAGIGKIQIFGYNFPAGMLGTVSFAILLILQLVILFDLIELRSRIIFLDKAWEVPWTGFYSSIWVRRISGLSLFLPALSLSLVCEGSYHSEGITPSLAVALLLTFVSWSLSTCSFYISESLIKKRFRVSNELHDLY